MSTKHQLKRREAHADVIRILDPAKVDLKTIRIILLTAIAVLLLLATPLIFLLRNFVTFDALDRYLKLTESVRPKILSTISEELSTGYSKNFIFSSSSPGSTADTTMLFYATPHQKVTLSVDATPLGGEFQAVTLQLNGRCTIGPEKGWSEPLHLYDRDLTELMETCPPDEPNLHSLRIVLPEGLKKSSALQVKCLVVVHQRVYARLEKSK